MVRIFSKGFEVQNEDHQNSPLCPRFGDFFSLLLNMQERNEIRIKGVPNDLDTVITTISKNLGISKGDFIKTEIRKIVDNYPAHLKVKK